MEREGGREKDAPWMTSSEWGKSQSQTHMVLNKHWNTVASCQTGKIEFLGHPSVIGLTLESSYPSEKWCGNVLMSINCCSPIYYKWMNIIQSVNVYPTITCTKSNNPYEKVPWQLPWYTMVYCTMVQLYHSII